MKKIIRKFWGVGLVLILLSALLVGAVPQASAFPYAFFNSLGTPNSIPTDTTLVPAAATGFSVLDVDQSGGTVIVTATDNAGTDYLYRSVDGGETWVPITPVLSITALGGNGPWSQISIAPDNPNIFAVVDTQAVPHKVFLTDNGGVTFSQLTALANNEYIQDVDISPLFMFRYLTIVGNIEGVAVPTTNISRGFCQTWTIGILAPAWTATAGLPGCHDIDAVQYSTSFAADQCMFVVTSNFTDGESPSPAFVALRVYSYNTAVWDAAVDVTFPRLLESQANTTTNITSATRVRITLDDNFYLGDAAAQIGFIGAGITAAGVEAGGVYRIGTYTAAAGNYTLTQIMTGTAINDVAWDGTNLMAAQYDIAELVAAGLVVWRSANALGPIPTWFQNSAFKTPGTGTNPLVIFNSTSGNGYCFAQGKNSAVARTTDYGLSFNGIALVNTHFGNMLDFWVSPDASRVYALTSDNYDLNLWRRDSGVWQRVFILAGAGSATVPAAQTWLVRASDTDSDAVYLGRKGAQTMYKSLDAGDFVWSVRAAATNIADFAVQDASTVYVASSAANIISKSVTGAFTWLPGVAPFTTAAANVPFSIELLAPDQMVVGGNAGGVGYSADGAATFTYLGATTTAGNTLVAATGVASGDTIWALDCTGAGAVYRWLIGTSVTFIGSQSATATAGATGLAYADGVLYVLDNVGLSVDRYLYPTNPTVFGLGATDALAFGAAVYNQTFMVNSIQNTVVTNSLSIYAIATTNAMIVLDTIDILDDYLTGAEDAPVPIYPINNTIIPINSISGIVNAFTFQWEASPTIAMTSIFNTAYNYNVVVYLDEAGTIPFAGSAAGIAAVLGAASPLPSAAEGSGFGTVGGNIAFAGVPGTAYYWRVRVDANAPAESYWSPMQTFNVQQLEAIVPVIASPENGTEVNTTMPAFSWSPIANATSYQFELATDADFTDIIYSATPASAGAQADVELTRGGQYFWRVKALTPTEGEWSTVANFIVAELPPTSEPPVTITTAPAPTVTAVVTQPAPTTTVVTVPPDVIEEVNPSYIWAIIIIGAVLVIAVIVLIVRTRRSV
jgi:hypothetical protein